MGIEENKTYKQKETEQLRGKEKVIKEKCRMKLSEWERERDTKAEGKRQREQEGKSETERL